MFSFVRGMLEDKMLIRIQKITSGKEAWEFGLEQAREMGKGMTSISPEQERFLGESDPVETQWWQGVCPASMLPFQTIDLSNPCRVSRLVKNVPFFTPLGSKLRGKWHEMDDFASKGLY